MAASNTDIPKVAEKPKKEEIDYANFDWVALTKEIRASPETGKAYVETDWEKFKRKFGDNPLVPIGCAVTTGFLITGIVRSANMHFLLETQCTKIVCLMEK